MGCFYCDEHHEGREAIMFKVGDMKAGTLYLFKDQAHKGRCALALKSHKKELCECDEQERNDYCADLAAASGAIKKLWGCTKINLGSFGDSNPHLHFHIVPKYEGGFEFGGSFAITNPEPVFLKDKEISEDEARGSDNDIQKLTDKFIAEVDTVTEEKEKEIMTV